MIKIVIILESFDATNSELTESQFTKIQNWFAKNSFIIPFVPQIGMMIDLVSFCSNIEEIYDEIDLFEYVTITKIVICKNEIELHCI